MYKGGGPVCRREARSKQQGSCAHDKFVVVNLNGAILRRAISTSGFQGVVKFLKDEVLEILGAGKFATLISTDASARFVYVLLEELADNVEQRVLGGNEEDPYIPGGLIND